MTDKTLGLIYLSAMLVMIASVPWIAQLVIRWRETRHTRHK